MIRDEQKISENSTKRDPLGPHGVESLREGASVNPPIKSAPALNDKLLPGPNLLQKLEGTIFQFREGAISSTPDIEQMFHQVRVKKKENNHCLKFLYQDIEIKTDKRLIYKQNRHMFRARRSSIWANYAMTKSFDDRMVHKMSNLCYLEDFIYSKMINWKPTSLNIK